MEYIHNSLSLNPSYVFWVSLDPVKCTIDFYPPKLSQKIENNFIKFKNTNVKKEPNFYLGSNFFDATIHYSSNNNSYHYQTTPIKYRPCIQSYRPGYRIVKRINLKSKNDIVILYAKKYNDEWYIIDDINSYNFYPDEEINKLTIEKIESEYLLINKYDPYYDYNNTNLEIPNEYLCPISQDIMSDPVNTSDNHTYDRIYIEEWFQTRYTSPLTGLVLEDITLKPNKILAKRIKDFININS